MKQYNIYRINEHGRPVAKQTIHAINIAAAWLGNKNWYYDGIFLITSCDGSEAKIFTLNRSEETK